MAKPKVAQPESQRDLNSVYMLLLKNRDAQAKKTSSRLDIKAFIGETRAKLGIPSSGFDDLSAQEWELRSNLAEHREKAKYQGEWARAKAAAEHAGVVWRDDWIGPSAMHLQSPYEELKRAAYRLLTIAELDTSWFAWAMQLLTWNDPERLASSLKFDPLIYIDNTSEGAIPWIKIPPDMSERALIEAFRALRDVQRKGERWRPQDAEEMSLEDALRARYDQGEGGYRALKNTPEGRRLIEKAGGNAFSSDAQQSIVYSAIRRSKARAKKAR